MAAGIATLKTLRDSNPYPDLEKMTERLATGIEKVATSAGVPHSAAQVGSMMTMFFNPEPVTDWGVAARSDTQRYADYFHGLLMNHQGARVARTYLDRRQIDEKTTEQFQLGYALDAWSGLLDHLHGRCTRRICPHHSQILCLSTPTRHATPTAAASPGCWLLLFLHH